MHWDNIQIRYNELPFQKYIGSRGRDEYIRVNKHKKSRKAVRFNNFKKMKKNANKNRTKASVSLETIFRLHSAF